MRRMAASNGARSDGNFRDSFSEDFGVHDILERDRRRRSTVSRQESYMMSGALSSTRRSSAQSDALGPNNDEFRVSKSRKAPIQPPTRYRAAFLSGQPLIPKESTYTGRISTTQSDYWRLVGLGINPDDVRGDRNSRKRYREFDADEEALMSSGDEQSTSPPERKKRIAMGTRDGYRLSQSGTPSGENRNAGTPTSAPSTCRDRADSNASEDPLLVKFRLLRKTLNEETDFMRSMNQQLEKRTSESIRSSSADPRDRSYNSFRSSHFPQVQAASVSRPAYWDRDSKFLPRSEYGGARWLAQKQMEKGKEKVVEQSPQLMKSNSASQLPTQSSTSVTTQSSKMSFSQQIPASQPMDSQENPANAFSVFAPGSNNQLDSAAPSNSFSSAVPDSNPFVQTQPSDQPTPNGVGTQGDEIMILSSDDDDDDDDDDAKGQEVQSQIPVKSKEYPTNDDDEIMEVNHDELSQSVAGEFQYGQHEEFGSQFEDQYRYAQGFETLDKEDSEIMRDEVDPALLDEDDEEESQVAGEDDEEGDASEDANEDDDEDSGSVDEDDEDEDELEGDLEDNLEDDLEDESSVDEEEIVEDEDESLEEESASEDASDERDATPNAKYKDKGNSFEDAIEL
ncbi:SAC3/GANP/Nin1/mts3/eIF-3 p25 [Neofusicoccum parvum]|nr:SAC3/GANP/Nin1/mts3/eIF-3 p25 [Neofusicoccum parvum]